MREQNTTLYNGDCKEIMKKIESESIDLILIDPPYELSFMGKGWDNKGIAFDTDMWKQAYNTLKDGGYMAVFSGTRTFHNMAVAIEKADFEIVDVIGYIYGSGFPKALDISKAIDKKMGVEREIVGINKKGAGNKKYETLFSDDNFQWKKEIDVTIPSSDLAKQYDGYKTALKPAIEPILICKKGNKELNNKIQNKDYVNFIYQAKASKKDRNMNILGKQITGELKQKVFNGKSDKPSTEIKDVEKRFTTQPTVNNHATVKPTEILKKVFNLLEEDKPMVILDMFAGSGSLGVAMELYNQENNTEHKTILIEMEQDHIEIIKKRCLCEVQDV